MSQERATLNIPRNAKQVRLTREFTSKNNSFPMYWEHLLIYLTFRIIRLPNGIEAWCISDPQADTSAAAMTICAGTNNDPKHLPGLAHFVEHVISMGSKKVGGLKYMDKLSSSLSLIQSRSIQTNCIMTT